jgi:hypothetical protein
MAQRTSRRRIRDRLDAAAKLVSRAEGDLASVVALLHERGVDHGYLVEMMRTTLETTSKQINDYRATRI